MTRAKGMFGPMDREEEAIFAVEGLLADVQLSIQEAMLDRGVSRSELARRLGCSPANVTQLLSEDANLTVQTVARIFHRLGMKCEFRSSLVADDPSRECAEGEAGRLHSAWEIALTGNRTRAKSRRERKEARGKRHRNTSVLIMEIAQRAAQQRPIQPVNSNTLPGGFDRASAA